jgi:branched-subunit amino acid aminotransferase/4-amino-4-deoxychorismate lyase
MLVFLNGRLVPEDQAVVSVFDRGFLYGDGLFETMRVFNGQPFRWRQHLDRLRHGARFLGFQVPFADNALRGFAKTLIARNRMPDALLRLTLSRGVGPPGYSPRNATRPALVISLHPPPGGEHPLAQSPASRPRPPGAGRGERALPRWKLITASPLLPAGDPLAQFKTANKLAQVVARAEADAAGADEALLRNTEGFLVEGASSNLFWIAAGVVCTSPLAGGILPGVTRAVVQELCRSLRVKSRESFATARQLAKTEGVFLSLSSWGIVPARSLDGRPLRASALTDRLRSAYWDLVCAETA